MRRFLQASWWIYSAKDRRGFSRNSRFFTAVLSGLIFGISACLGTDPASPAADHPQISPTTIKLPSTFTPAAAVESSLTATLSIQPSSLTTEPSPAPRTSTAGAAALPTTTSKPVCQIPDPEGSVFVLHDKVLFHPGPSSEDLDEAIAQTYPGLATFRQQLDWYDEPARAGQVIEDASFEETFQLNSAVTLVTVGVDINWQLPAYGDLYYRSRKTGEQLVTNWYEYAYPGNEEIQAQYPHIANGATYALFKYYDFNLEALIDWCEAYRALFNTSPTSPP